MPPHVSRCTLSQTHITLKLLNNFAGTILDSGKIYFEEFLQHCLLHRSISVESHFLHFLLGPLSAKSCWNLAEVYQIAKRGLVGPLSRDSWSVLSGKFRGHFWPFGVLGTLAAAYNLAIVFSRPVVTSSTLKDMATFLLFASILIFPLGLTTTSTMNDLALGT